jgi:trypsin
MINSGYNSASYQGDVSIMKLATSIPTSSTISYAVLPASGSDPASGTVLTTAGWGTTSSGSSSSPTNLLKVDVPVIARNTCANMYVGRNLIVTT